MKDKIIIKICLFILIIVLFWVYNKISSHKEIINSPYYINWKNVKEDFCYINEKYYEFFQNNKELSYFDFKREIENGIDEKVKLASSNIEKYGKLLCSSNEAVYVRIENKDYIKYCYNESGFTCIVYSKNENIVKKDFKNFTIIKLDDEWYYVHQHHI